MGVYRDNKCVLFFLIELSYRQTLVRSTVILGGHKISVPVITIIMYILRGGRTRLKNHVIN